MKKNIILLLWCLTAFTAQAAIHTVDNTPGSGAQFSSIQAAINAATPGDTILVHPSGTNYGNITLNKQVHLVGPGFNPEITDGLTAEVGIININNNSSGSIIEGFRVNRFQGALFNQANDIQIRNNFIFSSSAIGSNFGDNSNSDNWIIEGNLIIDAGGCGGCILINVNASQQGSDNWIIRNNIIQIAVGGNTLFSNLNSTTSIVNNIIIHRSTNLVFNASSGATITNNILYANNGVNDMTANCVSCQFSSNLFYTNLNDHVDVGGNGNIVNQDPLFVQLNNSNPVYNPDNDYQLQEGSPAAGSGDGGDDMGIFGADFNFRVRGYPNSHPRMTSVNPSFIAVPPGETFEVEIEAVRAGQ